MTFLLLEINTDSIDDLGITNPLLNIELVEIRVMPDFQ